MSPLPPPPPSARPPTPQPRRKTSLRTVPKQVQEQFKRRVEELRADPLRVLPETEGPVPKPLQKVEAGLRRVASGKAGFLLRRDKGIVGAVVHSIRMADKPVPSRLLDAKVGGQRRFFTTRGQVERHAMLGVQNHDHPPSLLMAYRSLAKEHGLHFFASPRLWCTGDRPSPPEAWVQALATRAEIDLEKTQAGWTCGHEGARVVLRFRGGPDVEVCAACGKSAGNLHRLLAARYAGPRQRQPVEVLVRAPDGQEIEPPRELVAEYRGAAKTEADVVRGSLVGWKPRGKAWMLSGTIHTSLEAWLDALHAHPWERTALAVMADEGYSGGGASVADVLHDLAHRLPDGLRALHDDDPFLAAHAGQAPRDQLRAAHEESQRAARTAVLPKVATGPVGRFLDDVARAQAAGGRGEAIDVLRRRIGEVPGLHAAAVLAALGGDVGIQQRIPAEERKAAEGLVEPAQQVLTSTGQAYLAALAAYLQTSGTGETVR